VHSPTNPKIHLWLPDIFQFKGGIQVYSSFLLQAIAQLLPQARLQVCLKHDIYALPELELANTPIYSFAGKFPLSLRTLAYSSQILSSAIRDRPDLIIATHANFSQAAYWLKRFRNIPYWIVAHGLEVWNLQNPKIKQGLQNADLVLAVSEYTRDRLIQEQNLNPAKVVLLPNTFDPNYFSIAPKPSYLLARHQLNPNTKIMLTVSRLDRGEQYKGYDRVLQVMPQLLSTIPNLHYLIVGKGSDTDRINQTIQALNLTDKVTMTGFVSDRELSDYYNLCDLFVMPSKKEEFGIVFLEALACGKPVIAGNRDGSVTALRGGKLGILVDPDNLIELEQAITQILTHSYKHPLIYQPESLRSLVIDEFGQAVFQSKLKLYLEQHFGSETWVES
jgi:glycosyltransferase involved in cell wall biosynthesis